MLNYSAQHTARTFSSTFMIGCYETGQGAYYIELYNVRSEQ